MYKFNTKHILYNLIKTIGPISVADYMKFNMQNLSSGYYLKKDPFNSKGDFVTAPEISQMFGESIAIWLWIETLHKNRNFTLIELGPGRGTMMKDIIITLNKLANNQISRKIKSIHLVETSPILRKIQKQTLEKFNIEVQWHDSFQNINLENSLVPCLVANEFFDALPTHQFQLDNNLGWRETFVDIKDKDSFQFVSNINETLESKSIEKMKRYSIFKPPANIEISFETLNIIRKIATMFSNYPDSLGVIIDYGPKSTVPINSLRGIKNHKFVNPLDFPGDADLSVDVDFQAIRAILQNLNLSVQEPISQATFLKQMGIETRAKALKNSESQLERLVSQGPNGMGKVYNVLPFKN